MPFRIKSLFPVSFGKVNSTQLRLVQLEALPFLATRLINLILHSHASNWNTLLSFFAVLGHLQLFPHLWIVLIYSAVQVALSKHH